MLKPNIFILDVDGVLTDGKFHYSEEGKVFKVFGADDNDSLKLLDPFMEIIFVSGDKRGFNISHKRVQEDMKRPIHLVSTSKRIDWIKKNYDTKKVIYMGDGVFDFLVFNEVGYSIAPKNSNQITISNANYVTDKCGGDRAVSEAVIHILEKFFNITNIEEFIKSTL